MEVGDIVTIKGVENRIFVVINKSSLISVRDILSREVHHGRKEMLTVIRHIHARIIFKWASSAKVCFYSDDYKRWYIATSPTWDEHLSYKVGNEVSYGMENRINLIGAESFKITW